MCFCWSSFTFARVAALMAFKTLCMSCQAVSSVCSTVPLEAVSAHSAWSRWKLTSFWESLLSGWSLAWPPLISLNWENPMYRCQLQLEDKSLTKAWICEVSLIEHIQSLAPSKLSWILCHMLVNFEQRNASIHWSDVDLLVIYCVINENLHGKSWCLMTIFETKAVVWHMHRLNHKYSVKLEWGITSATWMLYKNTMSGQFCNSACLVW